MQTGSGYGSLNILTPSEALGDAATAQQRTTQSQLLQAVAPDEVAQSGLKTQASQLALADAQKTSQLKNTLTDQELIANAAALVDPNDPDAAAKWDQAMSSLADKGVAEAGQFVGRYSTGLKGRVANAYSAATPASALGAIQTPTAPVSGLAAVGAPAAPTSTNYDQQFANATPQQIQAAFAKVESIKGALTAVQNSQNPAAEWDKQAQAIGHPEWVGHYSPDTLAQQFQQLAPADNYLRSRLTAQAAGLPAPLPPEGETKEVGGVLYERNAQTGNWVPKTPKLTEGEGLLPPDTRTSTEGAVPLGDFVTKLQGDENGSGNPDARNPKSSAAGNGQFLKGTWLPLIKQELPAVAAGKTDAQLLALRSDPTIAAQMTQANARNNGVGLSAAGDPVTGTTLAMAHKLGLPATKAVLTSSPDTSMHDALALVDPAHVDAVMTANPQYKTMTTGDFTRSLAAKFGNQTVAIPGLPEGSSTDTGVPGVKVLASGALITDGNSKLSDDAKDFIAQTYIRTGQLPPLGMGKAATLNRNDILSRAAQIETATGKTGGDAVLAWSNMKADRTSLGNLAKQSDAIKSFEGTALANADQVLQLAPKGVGGSAPVLNRWINAGRAQVAGDPDVSRFNTAIGTFADEYSKVVSGGTGSQATTDSAKAEAYRRINGAQTLPQIQAVVDQMKIEMENRRNALDTQRAAIESRISGGPAPAPAAAAAPAAQVQRQNGYPVLTPELARVWGSDPANKGKKFYTTDGRQMAF